MILESLATALPPHRFSQKDCLDILDKSKAYHQLGSRQKNLVAAILGGDSGIDSRNFVFPHPQNLFDMDATSLNKAFESEAPALGEVAIRDALESASLNPEDLDALFVCTCTGYLCPGLTSHLSQRLGMKGEAYLADLVGLGCGAAIPNLRAAQGFLAANPGSKVATLAIEICSAAFYMDQDIGVLISMSIFGDAASAAIWSDSPRPGAWKAGGFQTLHWPDQREKIRFINENGKLKNQLHRSVPQVAAKAVSELFERRSGDPDQIISHTGGRDVLDQIESALPQFSLAESRDVLREAGNCSSPSVMMALKKRLDANHSDSHLWLTGFGAGFTAHSCELSRT